MKKIAFLILSAVDLFLSGCVMTPVQPMDRRVTLSPELYGDVYVTDIRCAKGTSDFCTFQANMVNNTDAQYPIEWKVLWLDADGIEIESLVSTWNSLVLQPFEVRGLKGTAPRSDAADMRFYARRAQ